MKTMTNFPVFHGCLDPFGTSENLRQTLMRSGLDGLEVIWGEAGFPETGLDRDMTIGYHLPFWHDWIDFWRGDQTALLRKFGTREAIRRFYGSEDRSCLLVQYQAELERAEALGAEYVVFHMSDVSLEEGFTYQWEHTDREVIDASFELLNLLTQGRRWPFAILVENQWWPGFTFTDPDLTAYLLEGIRHPDKGLLLDTGHLMSTNPDLTDEAAAIAYIHQMLDRHGDLACAIRGIHLHQSLSGEYVRANTGYLPADLHPDYFQRFSQTYPHILKIDRHEPWTHPDIAGVIQRIAPEWLTHELSAAWPAPREEALRLQRKALGHCFQKLI